MEVFNITTLLAEIFTRYTPNLPNNTVYGEYSVSVAYIGVQYDKVTELSLSATNFNETGDLLSLSGLDDIGDNVYQVPSYELPLTRRTPLIFSYQKDITEGIAQFAVYNYTTLDNVTFVAPLSPPPPPSPPAPSGELSLQTVQGIGHDAPL